MSNLDLGAAPRLVHLASGRERVRAPLLRKGNALRLVRGGAVALGGSLGVFLLMAHDARLRFGVPLGAILVVVATFGVMDLLGTFDDAIEHRARSVTLRALAWPIVRAAGMAGFVCFALWGVVNGVVGQAIGGAAVTAGFIGLVASVFALGAALGPWIDDEHGRYRGLLRRHGFWLLVVCALLYLPALGAGSLWDPWETHYGEVSREILARDDWISTWWGWEGWFFSKPIIGQWMQAIAMSTIGVHAEPGRMMEGWHGHVAHPEWAVRAPTAHIAMLGAYILYKGVAKHFGRRAGLLGAIALATMPEWFLLAHQTMTDMPFVASMSGAMGLVLLGVGENDETRARVYEVTVGRLTLRFSAWHLVFSAVLAVAIPQIVYLVSRNLELVLAGSGPHGFRAHLDQFQAGSAGGNCALPGNPACGTKLPASKLEPCLQALVWIAALVALLWTNWGERRKKRLFYIGAWFFAALATMAKGPAGFGLPVLCVLVFVCATRRWREIPRFELGSGALVIAVLALPWFVAMLVRHGSPFSDELIFHDMLNRAFDHVHDTNDGVDTSFRYYVWQLGYALFPWTGLAPIGLLLWTRKRDDVSILLVTWFLVAFALFAMMGTKFHHYIFPAVPPVAMLIGIALDRLLARAEDLATTHDRVMLGAASLAGAFGLALVARDLVAPTTGPDAGPINLLRLFTYQYHRPWPASLDFHVAIFVFAALAVGAMTLMSIGPLRRFATWGLVGVAVAWAAWGLDVYMPKVSPHFGQRAVIEAYYLNRAGESEPLAAYQLNWKGENFYTGNRVAQFTSGGPAFSTWVREQKAKGTSVIFVATERNRVGGVRSDSAARVVTELTTAEDSNQFVLLRAEL